MCCHKDHIIATQVPYSWGFYEENKAAALRKSISEYVFITQLEQHMRIYSVSKELRGYTLKSNNLYNNRGVL